MQSLWHMLEDNEEDRRGQKRTPSWCVFRWGDMRHRHAFVHCYTSAFSVHFIRCFAHFQFSSILRPHIQMICKTINGEYGVPQNLYISWRRCAWAGNWHQCLYALCIASGWQQFSTCMHNKIQHNSLTSSLGKFGPVSSSSLLLILRRNSLNRRMDSRP